MAEPDETIVFEDSPAGVTAAIAAKLCVYVIGETPLTEPKGVGLGSVHRFYGPDADSANDDRTRTRPQSER